MPAHHVNQDIFIPKQQRSQDTQTRLLAALHVCLQDKFFEHINIKELAEHAGVSVGTFYRRFKNKESLLPLLYQDFGQDLATWCQNLSEQDFTSLEQAVSAMTSEMFSFLNSRKSVFRTLHLNARLHSEILMTDEVVDRKAVYQQLASVLLNFSDEITAADHEQSADMVIYTMITSLLDKVLYPDLTPAVATDLNGEAFTKELSKMLNAYLTI